MSHHWIECRERVTLEPLVGDPYHYGIFYGRHSLRNVLQFVRDHPVTLDGATESAFRKIQRCIGRARSRRSHRVRLEYRIARQLQIVHRELVWAELDRRLKVASYLWNRKRYAFLARELSILATMHEYWWRRWPDTAGPAPTPAGEKIRLLSRAMTAGWRSVRDHLESLGISWKTDVVSRLAESERVVEELRGESKKALYRDQRGGGWLVKYDEESILNPVLATIFSKLTSCPGGEICPVLLDFDPKLGQPCSVQPYLKAERIRRFAWCSRQDYIALLGGSRLRASQALCQAVQEWLLGNCDGYQVIMDSCGNIVFIDHDRSFFHDAQLLMAKGYPRTRRTTTSNRDDGVHDQHASGIRKSLIQATLQIPGVAEDLAAYISRVEAVPDVVYEGLARNASHRANELCSLFYVDLSDSSAMASLKVMEQWIETLVARKRSLRRIIAQRLREALQTTPGVLRQQPSPG
jgi:hypothetical protein